MQCDNLFLTAQVNYVWIGIVNASHLNTVFPCGICINCMKNILQRVIGVAVCSWELHLGWSAVSYLLDGDPCTWNFKWTAHAFPPCLIWIVHTVPSQVPTAAPSPPQLAITGTSISTPNYQNYKNNWSVYWAFFHAPLSFLSVKQPSTPFLILMTPLPVIFSCLGSLPGPQPFPWSYLDPIVCYALW